MERRLGDLVAAAGDAVDVDARWTSVPISGLSYDSRAVAAGHLFFCIPGTVSDGHRYAGDAAAAGAAALVVERRLDLDIPQVVSTDARRAMGRIASAWYGGPGDDLLLLGVTGTNGKTTTAYLLESILRAAGHTTGLIGTVETRIAGRSKPGVRTTPESVDLQATLAEMRDAQVTAAAMEVTSHALVLHRVEGLRFDAASFTNLSQDHLDFHEGMEDYFAAKSSLFVPERLQRGAVNVDDPYGRKLLEATSVPSLSFGLLGDADVRATKIEERPGGTSFVLQVEGGGPAETEITTTLVGGFNVLNCLAAATTALQAGIDVAAIRDGLAALAAVPGRFEAVDAGQPFAVVVDYAHTPDSLDNVLREARRMADQTGGRSICVFGCGGDRDRGKRPLMGAVAAIRADVVVVTSDNPRSEDPHAIIDQILEGIVAERAGGPDVVEADRREAIRAALSAARAGDVVVIAGKGHETGQEFADRTIPFDDREVARELLEELGSGAAG